MYYVSEREQISAFFERDPTQAGLGAACTPRGGCLEGCRIIEREEHPRGCAHICTYIAAWCCCDLLSALVMVSLEHERDGVHVQVAHHMTSSFCVQTKQVAHDLIFSCEQPKQVAHDLIFLRANKTSGT